MAKLIVEIDLPTWEYEDLKRDLIDDPDEAWFENEDVKTGNVAIYNMDLKKDHVDNSYYLFKLIDIKE